MSNERHLALLVHKLHVCFAMWFFLSTFLQVITWWWGVERHLRRLALEVTTYMNEDKMKNWSGERNRRSATPVPRSGGEMTLLAAIAHDTNIRETCAIAVVLSIAGATICTILSRCVSGKFVWGVLLGEIGTLISAGCLVGRGLMVVCERADRQEKMEVLRLERER